MIEQQFGPMQAGILGVSTDRGHKIAGLALYGDGARTDVKIVGRGDVDSTVRQSYLVVPPPPDNLTAVPDWLAADQPDQTVIGADQRIGLCEEVGQQVDVVRRLELRQKHATPGIGCTHMASESAVPIDGAQPFLAGVGRYLVYNRSCSNHRSLHWRLELPGFGFTNSDNSEVDVVSISAPLRKEAALAKPPEPSLNDLRGARAMSRLVCPDVNSVTSCPSSPAERPVPILTAPAVTTRTLFDNRSI